MWRVAMLSLLLLWLVVIGCSGSRSESPPAGRGAQTTAVPDVERANKDSYPAPTGSDFERFVLTGNEAPCPMQARGDCHSFLELLADGTLRMDEWGKPGAAVLEAHISPDGVRSTAAAVQMRALLDLLGHAKPCGEANRTETILVRVSGTDHQKETGHCNDSAIQSARAAALELASAHFPGHSLISPPF